MRPMETTSLEIFCSCADSPSDTPFLQQLERHLSVLQREDSVTLWHGRRIAAGSVRQEERDRHLNAAALIVLLVSSDFLASATCYREMRQAGHASGCPGDVAGRGQGGERVA